MLRVKKCQNVEATPFITFPVVLIEYRFLKSRNINENGESIKN